MMQSKIREMDDLPVESWHVTDEVILGKSSKGVEEEKSGNKQKKKNWKNIWKICDYSHSNRGFLIFFN